MKRSRGVRNEEISMFTASSLKHLFAIFSILSILYLITKYASKASKAMNAARYIVGIVIVLVLFLSLYNVIAAKTGLFSPISLDPVLNPIWNKIVGGIDRFLSWLFSVFHAQSFYQTLKERISSLSRWLS